MPTTKKVLATLLMLCASSLVLGQESREGQQREEKQAGPMNWGPLENAAATADVSRARSLSTLSSTASNKDSAIGAVRTSFKIYPAVLGEGPLPANGNWSVSATPSLAFLPACKASKASCLEVNYSVPARKTVCHWTVLFPAPTRVKGKEVQSAEVINEDPNAARYTMMYRLQAGMSYAAVKMQAPAYPAAARAPDWTGSVSVDVIISPQGKVVSIPDVRGPALLRPSAKEAVAKWVYAPTRLGAEDVARTFTVQVNYSVGGETIRRK